MKNNSLIGDKAKFAIESHLINPSPKWGNVVIWVNGYTLGDWEDSVFFYPVKEALLRISRMEDLHFEIASLKSPKVFKQFQNNVIQDKALPGFPENFDHYNMRVFKQNNLIHFLWQEMEWKNGKWLDKSEILLEEVKYEDYIKTVELFSDYIDKL